MKPIYSAPIACLTLWLGVATAAQTQNVGIGTAVPQARLHVVGGVRADGALAATPIAIMPTAGGAVAAVAAYTHIQVLNNGISVPNTLTLTGSPSLGQFLYVHNTDANPVAFGPHTVGPGLLLGFVYMGSGWVAISVPAAGNSLNDAYNAGGPGAGNNLAAVWGPLRIAGTDGLRVEGVYGTGAGIGTLAPGFCGLLFNPKQLAFRAGQVYGSGGSLWDEANTGIYSFVYGSNSQALGAHSTAFGSGVYATHSYTFAVGTHVQATQMCAVAFGQNNLASGMHAFVAGVQNTASGAAAVALGGLNSATGANALAVGNNTSASSPSSVALCHRTAASGQAAVALNSNTVAFGNNSLAGGHYTQAFGNTSVALGRTTVASGDTSLAVGSSTLASGIAATAMGCNTQATGRWSTATGHRSRATGVASLAIGSEANALLPTEFAHAGGGFASVGDAQYRRVVLRRLTTTATLEALTLDGNAPNPTNQVAVPVGAVYLFTIRLAAHSLAPANFAAGYVLTGVIRNAGGTTSFVGTPLVLAEFEDDALWEATAEANDTHDALILRVQGAAGHSIRWVGTVELVHVQ